MPVESEGRAVSPQVHTPLPSTSSKQLLAAVALQALRGSGIYLGSSSFSSHKMWGIQLKRKTVFGWINVYSRYSNPFFSRKPMAVWFSQKLCCWWARKDQWGWMVEQEQGSPFGMSLASLRSVSGDPQVQGRSSFRFLLCSETLPPGQTDKHKTPWENSWSFLYSPGLDYPRQGRARP